MLNCRYCLIELSSSATEHLPAWWDGVIHFLVSKRCKWLRRIWHKQYVVMRGRRQRKYAATKDRALPFIKLLWNRPNNTPAGITLSTRGFEVLQKSRFECLKLSQIQASDGSLTCYHTWARALFINIQIPYELKNTKCSIQSQITNGQSIQVRIRNPDSVYYTYHRSDNVSIIRIRLTPPWIIFFFSNSW